MTFFLTFYYVIDPYFLFIIYNYVVAEQLYSHVCISVVYMNKEKCPLRDCQTISKMFDYHGGELLVKDHAVHVTIPSGAISKDCIVQIEAAASLFGPFVIPEGYDPVSAYVWIGACYEFKKDLEVEIEHNIVMSEEKGTSGLSILTTCEGDSYNEGEGQRLLKMHKETSEYQCKIRESTFTFFIKHFCSKCLAAEEKVKIAKRAMMYHYLPESYKSEIEFVAEVCFCYDLTFCKEVISCSL